MSSTPTKLYEVHPDELYLQPNADFVLVLSRDDGPQTPWAELPWADV